MITESYEEWNILIQKLKERNSQFYDSDIIPDSDKDHATKDGE